MDNGAVSSGNGFLDSLYDARQFQRQQDLAEEALLRAFEPRHGCAFRGGVERRAGHLIRNAGCGQRLVQVLVDDLPGVGVGVVDRDLLGGQRVLEDVVFDAFEGKCAGRVEPLELQVARDDFHGGDAACADCLDEGLARGESGAKPPETEAGGIGEVRHFDGAGGRYIKHAGARKTVLQSEAGQSLFGSGAHAATCQLWRGVGHGVGLVEGDNALKLVAFFIVGADPLEHLVEPGAFFGAFGAQRGIGDEEDSAFHANGRAERPVVQWSDVEGRAADILPVAARVFDEGG